MATPESSQVMTVSKLYIYPIKSLPGITPSSAFATRHGFRHDRRYMLLRDHGPDPPAGKARYENMHVMKYYAMAVFRTEIVSFDMGGEVIRVLHRPAGEEWRGSIDIPLEPSVKGLESLEVNMHDSGCKGFVLGEEYDAWFSACFGFAVRLVYLGSAAENSSNYRPVGWEGMRKKYETQQGNTAPSSAVGSWFSSLKASIPLLGSTPSSPEQPQDKKETNELNILTFADCAPYLITSQTSCDDVSARFASASASASAPTDDDKAEGGDEPAETQMDMRKFRPNIVLSGASAAWQEDRWTQLCFTPGSPSLPHKKGQKEVLKMSLPHNCPRCLSINVSYRTGAQATGPAGRALALLMRDRRVDRGMKWSPVFGRYGFLVPCSLLPGEDGDGESAGAGDGDGDEEAVDGQGDPDEQKEVGGLIRVGDVVTVTGWAEETSVHDWP